MTLTLAPKPVRPDHLIWGAHFLRGLKFAEDGHTIHVHSHENPIRVEGQGDCVFYLFAVLKLANLWPVAWEKERPIELRKVRMTHGSRLATLDDYPVIRQFLEANAQKVEGEPRDADIVLMRWGTREGAPHHVALWAGEGFYHLPHDGVSGWQATDANWNEKIAEVWRLSAVIQEDT